MTSLATRLAGKVRRAGKKARQVAGIGTERPVILMYHRIASPAWDPWELCVPAEVFRSQLAALKAERLPLSMDELVAALEAGSAPGNAVALTFDDGYRDNFEVAKPLLEEAGVPATMFLTTGYVGTAAPFWWDELAALVLGGRRAASFSIEAGGTRVACEWGRQDALPSDLANWRNHDDTRDPRRQCYMRLWRVLQPLGEGERASCMEQLRTRLGEEAEPLGATGEDWPMSRGEAMKLPSPQVSLGAHARNHVPLTALPLDRLREEVAEGGKDIAALAGGMAPSGFAYPHGEWDERVRGAVIEAGYRWAVSTRPAAVDSGSFDRFTLPRMAAGKRSGPALLRAMRGIAH